MFFSFEKSWYCIQAAFLNVTLILQVFVHIAYISLLTAGLFAPRNEKMLPWFVSFCNSYIAWRWKVSLLLKLTRFKLVLTAVHPSKVLLSLPFKVFIPAVPKCWLWILGDLPFAGAAVSVPLLSLHSSPIRPHTQPIDSTLQGLWRSSIFIIFKQDCFLSFLIRINEED